MAHRKITRVDYYVSLAGAEKKGRPMFIVVVAWIIKRDVMRFRISLSERRLSTPWSFATRCVFPYARYLRDFPRRPFSRFFFLFSISISSPDFFLTFWNALSNARIFFARSPFLAAHAISSRVQRSRSIAQKCDSNCGSYVGTYTYMYRPGFSTRPHGYSLKYTWLPRRGGNDHCTCT